MPYNDPQETIKDLSPKLYQADQFYRDVYRDVIISLLDMQTTIRKTLKKKGSEGYGDTIAAGITIISSFFAHDIAQRFYEEHQRKRRQPEQDRKLLLQDASQILDRLNHRERMEYYIDFLSMGIIITNYKWQNVINQKPKKKAKILGYEKNVS